MILYWILSALLAAFLLGFLISFHRSGKIVDGIYDLIRLVQYTEQEIEGMKISIRAIAETTTRTAADMEKLKEEKEAQEPKDSESLRRAKEEIERFNEGIANILSFGAEEKDGDRK